VYNEKPPEVLLIAMPSGMNVFKANKTNRLPFSQIACSIIVQTVSVQNKEPPTKRFAHPLFQ
jgi:hypothetical protein